MPIVLNNDTNLEILENLKVGDHVTDGKVMKGVITSIEMLKATSGILFKISINSGKIFFITSSIDRPPVHT